MTHKHSWIRWGIAALAMVALASASSPARAATLTIKYEMTGGTADFPFASGGGGVTGGMFTVRYTAIDGVKTDGPATLLSFSAFTPGLGLFLSLTATPATGIGTAGSLFTNGTQISGFTLLYAATTFGPYEIYINGGNLNIQGSGGTASGFLTAATLDGSGFLSFTGREVSRTPEPGAFSLLLPALMLVGVGAARSLRARR